MKRILIPVLLVMFPAVLSTAAAAEGAVQKFERLGAPRAGADEPKREPVTFLGVAVGPAPAVLSAQLGLAEGHGLVVQLVEPDSPAARAGMKPNDLLTKFEDQILIEPRQLSVLVRGRKEGDHVTLTYLRGGAETRADVTLGSHVPSPVHGVPGPFGGTVPGDVLFRHARVLDSHELAAGVPGGPIHHPLAPGLAFGSGSGAAHDRVMIFRPQAAMVFSDDDGTLMMQVDEKGQNLVARDPDGAVVFSGPVNTPEQRAALPEPLRTRLEKFESLNVFEHPQPEPAPQQRLTLPRWDGGSPGSPVM